MSAKDCVINPKTKRAVRTDGKIGRGLIGASNILASAVKRQLDSKKPPPPPAPSKPQTPPPVKKTKEQLVEKGKALLKKFQDKKNVKGKDDDLKYSLSEFKKLRKNYNFNAEGGKNAYKIKAYIFRNNAETFANKIKDHYSKLTDKEKSDVKSDELDYIVSGKYFSAISDYYDTTTK